MASPAESPAACAPSAPADILGPRSAQRPSAGLGLHARTTGALVLTTVGVLALLVLLGGATTTGGLLDRTGTWGAGWGWVPVLLTLGVAALLTREIVARKAGR